MVILPVSTQEGKRHMAVKVLIVAKPCSVFLLIVLLGLTGHSQTAMSDKTPSRVKKIICRSGWTLPSLEQLSLVGQYQFEMDGKLVTKHVYKPKKELEESVSDFFTDKDGSLIVNTHSLIVRDVYAYEYRTRVFAYEITYVPYTISGDGVKRILGALLRKYYFDDDGDQLFETVYDTPRMPNVMPQWVTESQQKEK